MDAYQAILARRCVRKYKPDPVSRELLLKLVDAGRLAPTARNEQPWDFVVITQPEKRRQIAELAENGRFIAEAPACIAVLCRPTNYYIEDGSAATTQIMLAATALGLGACWIAGDKKPYAADVAALCEAPTGYKLVSLVAVGYVAEVPAPQKRALEDVVHWETFK